VNEKTNQNYREYTRALFAAESALKTAEHSIQGVQSLGQLSVIQHEHSMPETDVVAMNCPSEWWLGVVSSCEGLVGRVHIMPPGQYVTDSSASGPSFVIEHFGHSPGNLNQGEHVQGSDGVHHFRVLARGNGQAVDDRGHPLTTVFLQSIYSRAF